MLWQRYGTLRLRPPAPATARLPSSSMAWVKCCTATSKSPAAKALLPFSFSCMAAACSRAPAGSKRAAGRNCSSPGAQRLGRRHRHEALSFQLPLPLGPGLPAASREAAGAPYPPRPATPGAAAAGTGPARSPVAARPAPQGPSAGSSGQRGAGGPGPARLGQPQGGLHMRALQCTPWKQLTHCSPCSPSPPERGLTSSSSASSSSLRCSSTTTGSSWASDLSSRCAWACRNLGMCLTNLRSAPFLPPPAAQAGGVGCLSMAARGRPPTAPAGGPGSSDINTKSPAETGVLHSVLRRLAGCPLQAAGGTARSPPHLRHRHRPGPRRPGRRQSAAAGPAAGHGRGQETESLQHVGWPHSSGELRCALAAVRSPQKAAHLALHRLAILVLPALASAPPTTPASPPHCPSKARET